MGPALKHVVFALSQFWCFMVFWWLWSKNKGGGGGPTGPLPWIRHCQMYLSDQERNSTPINATSPALLKKGSAEQQFSFVPAKWWPQTSVCTPKEAGMRSSPRRGANGINQIDVF